MSKVLVNSQTTGWKHSVRKDKVGLRANVKHFLYLLHHKGLVFYKGLQLGVPIRLLIIHDWTKFTPSEWGPYTRWFYGSRINGSSAQLAFVRASRHHWQNNPHHWEYWCHRRMRIARMIPGTIHYVTVVKHYPHEPEPIPDHYLKEMIADWYAAGLAKKGPFSSENQSQALPLLEFYNRNKERIYLHPETRTKVEELLIYLDNN